MSELKLAIVGPGKVADRFLAPALARVPGARLWSVLSRDLGRARAFAERHGACAPRPAHDDLAALLADPELDAVILASPDALHASQGLAAARAGKHVLSEKPLCTDLAEGRALVEACRAAGVRLGVGYHLRHHAGHRALRERLRSGALGELRHARIAWGYREADATGWRAGTEVGRWWALAAVGTHALDLARWLLGPSCGEVVEARGLRSSPVWRGPRDETSLVHLRFASGATAELCASVLFRANRVELYGASGEAICEGTLGPRGEGSVHLLGGALPFTPADPYVGELADFCEAVRTGRAPEAPGEDGLRTVELMVEAFPDG